ncbi:hypothetical protein M758_6G168500 [Ceratodon purpureus]|nr:hypothetical protein M758_6G168500 [Ceratodon purpureus]
MLSIGGGKAMESMSALSAMAAYRIGDLWGWFCGGSKSPTVELGNCSKCITFTGLTLHYDFGQGSKSLSCVQHAIVCFGQLLLLLVFFLLLATSNSIPPGALTGAELLSTFEVGSVLYNVTSVLSALVGLAHVAVGVYLFFLPSVATHSEIYGWVQGIAWITIAVSLRIRLRNPTKQVAYVWWILTFFLTTLATVLSLIDLYNGVTKPSLEVYLAIASWPVACLLLSCAIRGERWIAVEVPQNGVTEPLLNGANDAESGTANGAREVSNAKETFYSSASFFSALIFNWLDPLLALGYKRPLELKDVPHLSKNLQAQTATEKFLKAWDAQKERHPEKSQSVFKALATVYWKAMALNAFGALGKCLALAFGPIILQFFIRYESGEELIKNEGYILVAALFCSKILESISQRHWYAGARMVGMELRSGLIATIYQKQLRLSNTGRARHGAGEIVNYMSVDCYRLGEFSWYFHQIWTTPLQLVIASVILFYTLGLATFAGLTVIGITMVLNSPLARALQRYQVKLMGAQDARVRASSEMLNSIKIIKLQAWEDQFQEKMMKLRENEFEWLSKSNKTRSLGTILYWMTPVLVSSITFGAYILLGHRLSPAVVFTSLSAFRIIQDPVRVLPELLAIIIQVQVSLGRIGNFLKDDELDNCVERKQNDARAVEMQDASLSWQPGAKTKPTLRGINLDVKPGDHVAVCGAVGSGKSTLLYSIMGEIPKLSGRIMVSGRLAYVAQSAWIQGGTIQDNVLFGLPMDYTRYRSSLKACALDQDIAQFPFGDQTEIGERGINMSGGQKQRIQLARAVYADADIYLLDDPFSALDAHTATTLFKDCVMGALKNKTVILVTHQVEFLHAVDLILVMEGGEIAQSGKYDDLLEEGRGFKQLVNAHEDAMGTVHHHDEEVEEVPVVDEANLNRSESRGERMLRNLSRARSRRSSQREPNPPVEVPATQLTQQEERDIGDQGWTVYLEYIRVAKGWLMFWLGFISQAIFVLGQMAANYWMATRVADPNTGDALLIGVYSGLSITSGIFVFMRSRFAVVLGLRASKNFFRALIVCLFRAPMLFFDSTPMGRILARISSDMTMLDVDVPIGFGFVSQVGLEIVGVIAIIAIVTYQILIVVLPVLLVIRWLQRYYLTSARELMRMNGTTKAPIVNNFGETISGAMTIRAFEKVPQFEKKNLELVDVDASLFFHTFVAYEWLVMRLEALCAIILATSALLMVVIPSDAVDGGFAGLSLVYGLTLNGVLVFFIQYVCQLANNIVSVERVRQYMKIESEAPAIIDDSRPSPNWPKHGKVELQNLQIRYRPGAPLVLKGITCTFQGGQRVGVVGRTGSGKTTLISALFRLVEPAGGRILIDGLDITTIGLRDLRSRLGIIPQEPTLFRGTVRSNLDPLGEHEDKDIWEALQKCQLAEIIRFMPEKLDAPVTDEGANWSVGQRQLFCLGRALLKHSRILVLDEATASIDSTTDAIIQKLIRYDFQDCTVITVAHRIPTVVDSDMVLALTDGVLAEYDSPLRLLDNPQSLFTKLVNEYWKNTRHLE